MKHIGIVAEYNPFHNGHAYQIEQIKKQFPEKKVIVIMSGNFVQRGEPAIYEKSLRTYCALLSGADIVLELPVYYAAASAEYFASAAVRLLSSTGVIDTLCFGAECDDISVLEDIATLLETEPSSYKESLKKYLSDGFNFPKARSIAVSEYFNNKSYSSIMNKPNNILSIEYIKAIHREKLPLKPIVIKRKDSDYSNTELTDSFPSATALREYIRKNYKNTDSKIDLSKSIPYSCHEYLSKNQYAKPVFFNDFYSETEYSLWLNRHKYDTFSDITEELANHLEKVYSDDNNVDSLIRLSGAKNFTHTRIMRSLLHILLDLKKSDIAYSESFKTNPYIRLLGFNKTSTDILHDIKTFSKTPIINKVADAEKILSDTQYEAFKKELQINSLYKHIFSRKYGITMPSEYQQTVIIKE